MSSTSTTDKHAERMKRLRELHIKRNEARQLNQIEVLEEDKRKQLPPNWESRKRQAEWILSDEKKRKEAEMKGEDYDRVKLLHIDATEAQRLEYKRKKKNPDTGFADYEQATIRLLNKPIVYTFSKFLCAKVKCCLRQFQVNAVNINTNGKLQNNMKGVINLYTQVKGSDC